MVERVIYNIAGLNIVPEKVSLPSEIVKRYRSFIRKSPVRSLPVINFFVPLTEKDDWVTYENFLRVNLSQWLLKHNGILLHSAGGKFLSEGIIFVGKSGSGKSTITRKLSQLKGYSVLSDEIVAIRQKGKQFYLYPTPFMGMFSKTVSMSRPVLLRKILFLQKNKPPRNYIRRAKIQDALKMILSATINFSTDKRTGKNILSFAKKLVYFCPSFYFSFNPETPPENLLELLQ